MGTVLKSSLLGCQCFALCSDPRDHAISGKPDSRHSTATGIRQFILSKSQNTSFRVLGEDIFVQYLPGLELGSRIWEDALSILMLGCVLGNG